MTLAEYIQKLQGLNPELLNTEIVIVAPNGISFEPEISFRLKNKYDVLAFKPENIDKIVITY